MRKTLRRLARRMGYDVRKIGAGGRPDLDQFLRSRRVDIVLDVGANLGQFGQELRDSGYRGRIVSFEPIASVFAGLKARTDRDRNWEAHQLALGASPGHATIKVSGATVFSSLLDQTALAQRFDQAAVVERHEIVEVARLDDLVARFRSRNVFLKIDTQGFERQVLDGAPDCLRWIAGVQLELPAVPLYQGVWSLGAAMNHMEELGFVVAQMRPVNHFPHDPVSAAELDCVFRRRDERDALD